MNPTFLLAALALSAAPVPSPSPPNPGRIAYCGDGPGGFGVHVITPDGKPVAVIALDGDWAEGVRLSHDGTRVAVSVVRKQPSQETAGEVRVYDLAKPDKPLATLDTGLPPHTVTLAWGADNGTLYVNRELVRNDRVGWKLIGWEVTRYDVATGKGTAAGLPADHIVTDVSPDGKSLLVVAATRREDGGFHSDACVADATALKPRRIAKGVLPYQFSPDGKRVIGARRSPAFTTQSALVVFDLKARTEAEVKLGGTVVLGHTPRAAWSADGTRLLVERTVDATGAELDRQRKAGVYIPSVEELFTCCPDGSGVRPLFEKTPKRWQDFDWR